MIALYLITVVVALFGILVASSVFASGGLSRGAYAMNMVLLLGWGALLVFSIDRAASLL